VLLRLLLAINGFGVIADDDDADVLMLASGRAVSALRAGR
jgi:hypothetical protein